MALSMHFGFTVVFFVLFRQSLAVDDDFCKTRKHYTGPDFTCCHFKRFDSPKTNPFKYRELIKDCLTGDTDAEKKLIKRTWLLYECLIKKEASGLSIEDFSKHMLKRFDSDKSIQDEINKVIGENKKHLPETLRRKRGLRVRRDVSDGTTEATAEEKNTDAMTMSTAAEQEQSVTTANTNGGDSSPVSEAENGQTAETTPQDTSIGSTEAQNTMSTAPDAGAMGTDPTSAPDPATDPPVPEPEPGKSVTTPRPPIPLFRYLSVFEYYKTFKDYIPNKELLQSWDVYYVAEFEACHRLSDDKDEVIKEFGTERCFSWLQRTARDGECCDMAPIPMPLFNHPLHERDEIRNFTAKNILSLAGTYIYDNITFSSNIDRCLRLALAVLEEQTSVADIRKEIDEYIANNATGPGPNYADIAEKLVPYYYHREMKDNIKATILPQNNPTCETKREQDKQFYEQIECDSDLQKIKDFATSIHQFAVASEWDNPHENKTRYLMWTCDAYRMVSRRIRYYDYVASNDCY